MSDNQDRDEGTRRDLLKIWAPAIILTLIGFVIAWQFVDPAPPKKLRIATGGASGKYYASALAYKEKLAEIGYELEVISTGGSVDNIGRLDRGEVDLAFVQGGTVTKEHEDMHSLCSLYFEPLWIFQRAGTERELLADFEGAKIAIGGEGSGTRMLALQIFAVNGVSPENSELLPLSGGAAADALLKGEIDAACFVSGLNKIQPADERPVAEFDPINRLIRSEGVELFSTQRGRAYRSEFPYLSVVDLGRGMVDLATDIPVKRQDLIAPAATLVASRDLDLALTPLILDVVTEVHRDGGLFEESGQFPSYRYLESEFPIADEARRYIEEGPSFLYRVLPFGIASTVQRLKVLLLPLITLLFPILKIAPPIYRFRIRYKIFRWYRILRNVDKAMVEKPDAATAREHLARLKGMEQELAEVKVPLSYMGEFYALRVHFDLVTKNLEARAKDLPEA